MSIRKLEVNILMANLLSLVLLVVVGGVLIFLFLLDLG